MTSTERAFQHTHPFWQPIYPDGRVFQFDIANRYELLLSMRLQAYNGRIIKVAKAAI